MRAIRADTVQNEMVGNDPKLVSTFHAIEESPDLAVIKHENFPAGLAHQVVVGDIGAALIDQSLHAHVGDGHFAGVHQPFEGAVNSGVVDCREVLTNMIIHLGGCQMGVLAIQKVQNGIGYRRSAHNIDYNTQIFAIAIIMLNSE